MPSFDVDLSFPHDYRIRILTEVPNLIRQSHLRYFPGNAVGRDGILVEVCPNSGEHWIGMFARGQICGSSGVTGVWSTPDSGKLCVMSKGNGYLVNATDPAEWQPISTDAKCVYSVAHKGLLLFASCYRLTAYGASGKVWSFDVTDELVVLEIDSKTIKGTSWEPASDSAVHFTLDISDGHRIQ